MRCLPQRLTPAPTRDERFYYEIGGAAAVSPPPSRLSTSSIGASFELGIRYSCGKFDPIRGIATQLDQVIERIKALVVNALSAAIAAAPMYILQRVNPGLYDLLQNLLSKRSLPSISPTRAASRWSGRSRPGATPTWSGCRRRKP